MVHGAEGALFAVLQLMRLVLDATAAFWIAVGFIYAVVNLVAVHLRGHVESFRSIRLRFSRYLSLALEFQLAADILSTAIAPTFQELGKLAIIAVIRTALNYFLSKEIREAWEDVEHEKAKAMHPDTLFSAAAPPTVRA